VSRFDEYGSGKPPAIAAREKKGPLAGLDQEARDRNRRRRLASAADGRIADADDRNAGARA
jgi:hypothetical protein